MKDLKVTEAISFNLYYFLTWVKTKNIFLHGFPSTKGTLTDKSVPYIVDTCLYKCIVGIEKVQVFSMTWRTTKLGLFRKTCQVDVGLSQVSFL